MSKDRASKDRFSKDKVSKDRVSEDREPGVNYSKSIGLKLADKVVRRLKRYVAPLIPTEALTILEFERLLESHTSGSSLSYLNDYFSFPLIFQEINESAVRETISSRFPECQNWFNERADACVSRRFCELGDKYHYWGDDTGGVDWLLDSISGVRWPNSHYLRVPITMADKVSDIKNVWEISRFQFAPNLAQCEIMSGPEGESKYREAFINLVDDWQRKNPYPQGPNWICAMEIALRSINILAAVELFQVQKALPEKFLKSVYVMLFQSGRHIYANQEKLSPGLNSNHYLADLLGLLVLGKLFEHLPEGQQWLNHATAELDTEIYEQTTDDGFCYESSSCYHLMVFEYYLFAVMFCRQNKIDIPISFMSRVSKMAEFTRGMTSPAGTLPNIGDNDSGRLFKFSRREDTDPSSLLCWATMEGLLSAQPEMSSGHSADTVWLYGGRKAFASCSHLVNQDRTDKKVSSKYYRQSGLAIMRHDDLWMSLNVSDIGVNHIGGHKHNDQLALQLVWGQDEFLIDPGVLCYTKDEDERNRLRSIQSHSTVCLQNSESNRFISGRPFSLRRDGAVRVGSWLSTRELDLIRTEHDCYSRLAGSPRHIRTVFFDKLARFWLIRDQIITDRRSGHSSPAGYPSDQWSSHLIIGSPAVTLRGRLCDISSQTEANRKLTLGWLSQGAQVSVENFTWAPSYSVARQGTRLTVTVSDSSGEMIWGVFPNQAESKIELSHELIQEKLRLLEWPVDNLEFSDYANNYSRGPQPVLQPTETV